MSPMNLGGISWWALWEVAVRVVGRLNPNNKPPTHYLRVGLFGYIKTLDSRMKTFLHASHDRLARAKQHFLGGKGLGI